MKAAPLSLPSLSHRFLATFFIKGIPSPMDLRFSRISGLGRELQMTTLQEGGNNLGSVYLPERVQHGSLVLERGVMPVTPVTMMFDQVLGQFREKYLNVVILLLDGRGQPASGWTLTNALPVKWQTGELDASGSAVLIDTLELAYHELHWAGRVG